MRAYRFDTLTSLDDLRLHETATPVPQRGEVLVRIRAVSLNYRDLAIVAGNYVWAAKPGLVPCSDAAGEIVEVGDDVAAWKPGDRVISTFHPRWFGGRPPFTASQETYGSGQDGWLCEYKVVSQEAVVRLPDALSWRAGSTLPCAATTAFNALSGPVPIRTGQTVLTLGSGGVSVFAIQLAKALGARVIGTTSSDRKGEVLRRLGVDEVVNYATTPHWGQHVKKDLTGGIGVDCVVEVGGPGTVNEALHAVRWGGEVVLIGFLTNDNPGIDYFHLKTVSAAGIAPVIDRVFAFEEARDAFAHLQSGSHIGKIVITLGD